MIIKFSKHFGLAATALAAVTLVMAATSPASAADKVRTRTSDFIMERTPIGRRGLTKEIVGPAIFLASDAASMVTGHILQVDGGYLVA